MRDLKVDKSSKFLLIGSTMTDILKVTAPELVAKPTSGIDTAATSSTKQALCKQEVCLGCIRFYG